MTVPTSRASSALALLFTLLAAAALPSLARAQQGNGQLPGGTVQTLRVGGTSLVSDLLAGRVTWRVTRPSSTPSGQ